MIQYSKYGPNCVILFGLMARLILFCLFFTVIIGYVLIVLNLTNYHCTKACLSDDSTYKISLFNII